MEREHLRRTHGHRLVVSVGARVAGGWCWWWEGDGEDLRGIRLLSRAMLCLIALQGQLIAYPEQTDRLGARVD